ncbi:unnamed protein product, partial [Mycena citricolor]
FPVAWESLCILLLMAKPDVDTPIRITVTPSQSSYFAGEAFAVTITYTNTHIADTHTPVLTSRARAHTQVHKRNAYSISSAPLARPPTSPGTPRPSAHPATPTTPRGKQLTPLPTSEEGDGRPRRRGVIGRTTPEEQRIPGLVEQRRKKMLAKSLSVSISLSERPNRDLDSGPHSPPGAISEVVSPISRRSDTLPLAASHPHARKVSLLDGQQIITTTRVSNSPVSAPASASSSTFSLALEPISEFDSAESPVRKRASLGKGHPSSPARKSQAEVLYTYASLAGRVVIGQGGPMTSGLVALRAALAPPMRGGGSLSTQAASAAGLSGATQTRHRRSNSLMRAIWGAEDEGDTPLPTLDIRPEMLAVDLKLGPGESRSYKYTINLPENMPPTFKGRTVRFSYELVVGVCRPGNVSRVMKVPIRVYNHVRVGRRPKPYDLMWPVSASQPKPSVHGPDQNTPEQKEHGNKADLQRYAQKLLTATLPSEDSGPQMGCRQAVEELTRNLRKVSYDITKDGVTVAVLTFPKSAYRLGETVNGVVEINWRNGRGRVLQVVSVPAMIHPLTNAAQLTALLEAHESFPELATTRRVHAEHHARFVLGTLRLGFALDIPSDGSPAFDIVWDRKAGGLEWKVRLCLLVAVSSEQSDLGTEGMRVTALEREPDHNSGAWGSSWRAPDKMAVLQRLPPESEKIPTATSWAAFLTASLLGSGEGRYHDGDQDGDERDGPYDGVKPNPAGGVGVGVRYAGSEIGWSEVKAEMVECVVPVSVWPGNTAFRPADVVFDV